MLLLEYKFEVVSALVVVVKTEVVVVVVVKTEVVVVVD